MAKRDFSRVLICSDFHCGHRAGLTPPKFQVVHGEGAGKHYTEVRETLWNWFATELDKFRPFDYILVLGDTIDGKGTKNGGIELITTDRCTQTDMAATVIQFVGAKYGASVHGSGYHAGQDDDWESEVATKAGIALVESQGYYRIPDKEDGLVIYARHVISGGNNPNTQHAALDKEFARIAQWTEVGYLTEKPGLYVYGHRHECLEAADHLRKVRGIIIPALCGLGSNYGERQCSSLPKATGFVMVDVKNADDYVVTPVIAPTELQQRSPVAVPKIGGRTL